jgi:hypothetical protein
MEYHITTPKEEPYRFIIKVINDNMTDEIKKAIFISSGLKSLSKEDLTIAFNLLIKETPPHELVDAIAGFAFVVLSEKTKEVKEETPFYSDGVSSMNVNWPIIN